jgi:hypothetical protein
MILINFELKFVQDDRLGLVSIFCRQICSFPSNICWRGCLFSIICFWHLLQKSGECSCVDSYLGFLFCPTGLHVSFCASTMLFLLLWLCSIVWSWLLWYLQHCCFLHILPQLLDVFCASNLTLGWFFNLCDECHQNFDGNCSEHIDCFWLIWPFSQYWFYQSMSMGDFSIFCSLLWFPSSMCYSFTCIGLSHPLLSLFLCILGLFFSLSQMELFSYILSQSVHHWCIERLLFFIDWILILLLWWSCLWCLGVFWWFFRSFKYRIISSATGDSLTNSFTICIPFHFSTCLIALARNSKTILNKGEENGRPCLIPDFRGNGFNMMLARFVICSLYYVEVLSFYS